MNAAREALLPDLFLPYGVLLKTPVNRCGNYFPVVRLQQLAIPFDVRPCIFLTGVEQPDFIQDGVCPWTLFEMAQEFCVVLCEVFYIVNVTALEERLVAK